MLPCGHFFHYTCLRSWLEQSNSCPICRASLTAIPARSGSGSGSGAAATGSLHAAGGGRGGIGGRGGAGGGVGGGGGGGGPLDAAAREAAALEHVHAVEQRLDRMVLEHLHGVGEAAIAGVAAVAGAIAGEGAVAGAGAGAVEPPLFQGAQFGDDGDGEGDEGEGEGEGEEEQTLLLFSSENWRWPSWLPRLHLEIIRRPVRGETTANVEAELAQLRDVFPQMTELALRRALLQSSSLEAAIESLLEASLDT